jgi:uncharacterized damage-inducible protein DinB
MPLLRLDSVASFTRNPKKSLSLSKSGLLKRLRIGNRSVAKKQLQRHKALIQNTSPKEITMATTLTEVQQANISAEPTIEPIAAALLAEFEAQAPITRRFLERLSEDKLTWKPHARSMSAGQLAYHLAMVPGGVVRFAGNNPAQAPDFQFPQPASCTEILKTFDDSIAAVRETLPKYDDAAMKETWHLEAGGREVLAVPRGQFLRDVMFSHWYQHRGQFCVYLRLLDIPVPASFGPSADEPPIFMQQA